jgi:hypothetical protein
MRSLHSFIFLFKVMLERCSNLPFPSEHLPPFDSFDSHMSSFFFGGGCPFIFLYLHTLPSTL